MARQGPMSREQAASSTWAVWLAYRSITFTSRNQLGEWLRLLDALRQSPEPEGEYCLV